MYPSKKLRQTLLKKKEKRKNLLIKYGGGKSSIEELIKHSFFKRKNCYICGSSNALKENEKNNICKKTDNFVRICNLCNKEVLPDIKILRKIQKKESQKQKYIKEYQGKPWNSKEWKEERKKLLEGYKNCEWCRDEKTLTIHHMKDDYEWGDTAYSKLEDKENIVRICSRCHYIYHDYNSKLCGKCHKKYHHIRWNECIDCFKKNSKNKKLIKKRVKEDKLIKAQKDKKYDGEKKFFLSIKKGNSYITYSKIPESLIPKWKKLYPKSSKYPEENKSMDV
jgi:hypothetical protein